jgi:hypothetical protein
MEEWRYSSTIPDLNNRWKLVVSFTARPQSPLDRGLGGPQSRSRHFGEEKNL